MKEKKKDYWYLYCSCEVKVKLLSCVRLFATPIDCSLPGFSIHGIFQASVLEWVAISFPKGSSFPRDQTQVSHIVGRHSTLWTSREAPIVHNCLNLVKEP